LSDEPRILEVKEVRQSTTEWVYDFSVRDRKISWPRLFLHNTTLSDSLIAGAG